MNPLLEAALAYARIGWYVFPCEPATMGNASTGKKPLTKNGKDDATTNETIIRDWWTRHPNANIGVAVEPSGLVILDVDTANGKRGRESLAEIESALAGTLCARTGSGGMHAIYARGPHEPKQHLNIRPGLDLIGKGYFIAPPSRHNSGEAYYWQNEDTIAPLPQILLDLKRERLSDVKIPSAILPLEGKQARIVAAARLAEVWPAKGRHHAFLALAGALAKEGWPVEDIAEFTTHVARLMPGCDEKALTDRPLQARDSVEKVSRGEEVSGWGVLSSVVPEDTINLVRERLGLVDDWSIVPTGPIDLGELGEITPQQIEAERLKGEQEVKGFRLAGELALIQYPPVVSHPTGFTNLDKLLGGGFSTQQLIVMIGRPGAGKTAFIIRCALHHESKVPVLYCSTELQHNEIVARLCSPILGVPWRDIVRAQGITRDGVKVTHELCAQVLRDRRIAVIGQDEIYAAGQEDGKKAVELIAKTAIAMKTHFGQTPIVFVDYMQELARGDSDHAKAENTKIAVIFRILSQRIDCAIVLVSSVSRSGYGSGGEQLRMKDDPTIYLSLAKESGDIEYAAATIMFLDVLDQSMGEGWRPGRIAVAKSRHGETGFSGVKFRGATGEWEEFEDGVKELSAERILQVKESNQAESDEKKILAKVEELAKQGLYKDKSGLQADVGGKTQRIFEVIKRLVSVGLLCEVNHQIVDPLGNKETKKVLMLAEDARRAARGLPIAEEKVSVLEIIGPIRT